MKKIYNFELEENEVLVLHALLSRIDKSSVLKDFFIDQSEQVVLWSLECLCEKNNAPAFSGDYKEILQQARDELRQEDF